MLPNTSLVDMTYPELARMERRERLAFLLHVMETRLSDMLRRSESTGPSGPRTY